MGYRVAAASMKSPSPSHSRNEDRFRYSVDGDYGVMVVADGAGSLPRSAEGADIVVDTVTDYCRSRWGDVSTSDDGEKLVDEALNAATEAVKTHDEWRDMGCTVAVVLVAPGVWACGVVGDAFAVTYNRDGEWGFVSSHRPEGCPPNVTTFVTSPDQNRVVTSGEGDLDGVAVSSDGLAHASIKDRQPHEGFWTPVIDKCVHNTLDLEALFAFMDERGMVMDDTTVVVASRIDVEDSEEDIPGSDDSASGVVCSGRGPEDTGGSDSRDNTITGGDIPDDNGDTVLNGSGGGAHAADLADTSNM